MLERPPKPSTLRQRRYKDRERRGDITVTITLSQAETAVLHAADCLGLHHLEDRSAIVDALHLLIANTPDSGR
jgi:hypothetical protein